MYKTLTLLVLLSLTYLNAALESDYKTWELREEMGHQSQETAPLIIIAQVASVNIQKQPKASPPLLHVSIYIRYKETIRNRYRLDIPKRFQFSYEKINYASGWVGPASMSKRTPFIPEEGKSYIFYLDKNFDFAANEYSIEDIRE